MKKDKSLCESCSNRVVIKFRHLKDGNHNATEFNKKSQVSDEGCYFNFSVYTKSNGNYGSINIGHLIVEECSFYNKNIFRKRDVPIIEDTDSDETKDSNYENGVTITNIPGVLLP
jgi:hypothetical protein